LVDNGGRAEVWLRMQAMHDLAAAASAASAASAKLRRIKPLSRLPEAA
jgi:plasmid maintenance system antidote protein VapI